MDEPNCAFWFHLFVPCIVERLQAAKTCDSSATAAGAQARVGLKFKIYIYIYV